MDSIKELRRVLHTFPEVSGEEQQTAKRITKALARYKPTEIAKGIGDHGIIATFDSGKKGPVLLFRAELDALPIEETNNFKYRSENRGVSHKCGHDGHMAIVVGLAKKLHTRPIKRGKVHLLFQPSEETGEGAKAMLDDPAYPKIKPDFAFALHNLPGYPAHQVICKTGTLTPAVRSLIVTLFGKTSHAAEPENGINPSLAIAKMIQLTTEFNNLDPASDDFFLITPVHILVGEKAYGVSAGYGELHLTIRCWTNDHMKAVTDKLLVGFRRIASEDGLIMETEWTNNFSANENDPEAVEMIKEATSSCAFDYKEISVPLKWGEDFGYFTQKYRGAMFGLGAGMDTPALHNPDYDFPDELIRTGVSIFNAIVTKKLR